LESTDRKKSEVVKWIDEHTTEMLDFCMDSIRYKSISGDELSIQRDFFGPFLKKMRWSDVDIFNVDRGKERPNINAV
jgi:hypothetical protein